VQSKPADDGKRGVADRRKPVENGQLGHELDPTGARWGESLYLKYYQQRAEQYSGQVRAQCILRYCANHFV
jgi:hypothetical protein